MQPSYQQNVITMHARKGLITLCAELWSLLQDKFISLKPFSRFPNFDASNAWQMGHNSQKCFSLVQELLLDFAAWIDLTSNTDTSISISSARSYRTHFASLKFVDDLRVYQGLMIPLNHQAAIQGTLKQCLRY